MIHAVGNTRLGHSVVQSSPMNTFLLLYSAARPNVEKGLFTRLGSKFYAKIFFDFLIEFAK